MCEVVSGKACFDCEQEFCANHIYSCADCGNPYCGDCLDAHRADGHWADSDTAFEFAASRGVARASSANPLDFPPSGLDREIILLSPENAVSHQRRQAWWSAIPVTLKSLFSLLATLLGPTFQSVALQSEAGL